MTRLMLPFNIFSVKFISKPKRLPDKRKSVSSCASYMGSSVSTALI
jgi:hypothetical protein